MKKEVRREDILRSLEELAFGRCSDAVKLAFMAEGTPKAVSRLDLRTVSELRRLQNGTVELKFIDRAKLIELLLKATEERTEPGEETRGLISAINTAADRLSLTDGRDHDVP